jgi:hypothetical protein
MHELGNKLPGIVFWSLGLNRVPSRYAVHLRPEQYKQITVNSSTPSKPPSMPTAGIEAGVHL